MGNTLSSMTSIPNVVNADYKLVGKTTNIRWGELFEMRNIKTGQYTFMQEKYAVNQEVHQKNVQDCSYRVSLVHKNLATIYGFAHNDNLDSFTNTFKLCIFFEHTPSNLSEVIRAHKTSMLSPQQQQSLVRSTISVKYFDESELLGYMDQLIDVLSFLQNNGINQGDITPEVCMVSSNGSVKLLDKKLIFNDTTSFALAGQGLTNVFLTPAELEALSGEESQPFENRYKADVFRLGMTLLECATLKKSAQIYDWSNYVIDLELLATRLAEVRERYSTSVYGPLREMLRFEEHKRPDFKQLRQSMQEDFNRTLLTTASMITPRGGGEENLKKSMGPKLVTSGSPRPDLTLSRNKPGSHSRVTSSQDMMETFKSAFKDVFDIGKKTKAKAKKEKREEDLDDDMVEMDENMKINQVPYTEEAKLTVVSNNDGRLYKTSSMKVAAVDRFGEEDTRGDTRLFKTMSVSEQVPWNSKVNLLKDNGATTQQKERRRGSIFGAQKTEGDSKSMAVRPHSRTVAVPETSSSSHYDGMNFQNAINLSQVNNGGQYGEHYKTSIPPVQMAKSQTSYHSFPTTDERQDTVSGNLSSRLKFNENFQTTYIPAVDDSPVSLHSQRYHTARDYDPAQSTGDIYDPEGYKKQGYKPSFKLNLGENRYGLDDYGTKSWSTTTRENDRYNKYLAKDYEVHSSRPEYPEYTKTTSYLDNNNTYTTTTSKPKVEKSLEAIKHPINDYLKTITSGSSLSYNTKSPLMYEHSRQQSYSGGSQVGYIDTGIKPYALTTTSSKLESIIGRKDYSPILEKSSAKEDDQYSSTTIGKGSAGLKIGEFQPEKPGTTNINDRFEQAMERSRRSKGFVRDMSTAMNRSGSRTGSVERGGSGFTSGIMTSNLVGLKIKP